MSKVLPALGAALLVARVSLVPTPAGAEPKVPDRAATAAMQTRLDALSARIEKAGKASPAKGAAHTYVELARRHAQLAQRALGRNAEQTATVLLRNSETFLDLAQGGTDAQGLVDLSRRPEVATETPEAAQE